MGGMAITSIVTVKMALRTQERLTSTWQMEANVKATTVKEAILAGI